MTHPDDHKECGGYVLGLLQGGVRRKSSILSRSAITLDLDTPDRRADLAGIVELTLGVEALIHTTYSSAPDEPRYRLLMATDRDMNPEEYRILCRMVMAKLGPEQFDKSSDEPERFMYLPAEQQPGWFQYWTVPGDPLPVDEWLAEAEATGAFNLRDSADPRISTSKRDPFAIEGPIGAFNRAFSLDEAIVEFDLPYVPAGAERWTLIGAKSEAGLHQVAEGLFFSHHVTDPCWSQTCSVFDVVRRHKFGELDEGKPAQTPVNKLPSHKAMMDFVEEFSSGDGAGSKKLWRELIGPDFVDEMNDAGEAATWKQQLRFRARTGQLIDDVANWDLIRAHDPVLNTIARNELGRVIEWVTPPPWRKFTDLRNSEVDAGDVAELKLYIEREYRFRVPAGMLDEMILMASHRHSYHPIKDYLNDLVWDGKPRVEECLPGVKPTKTSRLIARKCLVAAVARIMDPGCKWDHTLILFGVEGLGKTYWVDRLARGFSATLGRIEDKDTLITAHQNWIVVSDEGMSLRKADAESQKEFLTRTHDTFRAPYERTATRMPRQFVIWGSTNDEVFLRKQEGNRRFLIVHCESRLDFDAMTDEYVDQLWAEAVHMYRAGEDLFLDFEQSRALTKERARYIEEDALSGIIAEYLDTPVPDDWKTLSPDARLSYLQSYADGLVKAGPDRITEACSSQIWVEALKKRIGDQRRADLLDINKALRSLPGWKPDGHRRIRNYGPQSVFVRTAETGPDPDDLL